VLDAVRFAPVTECVDRAQLARELLAQQFEGELGHRSRRHVYPEFVFVVAPDLRDGGADILGLHLDRAVLFDSKTHRAKLGSLLAGNFDGVAGHAASALTEIPARNRSTTVRLHGVTAIRAGVRPPGSTSRWARPRGVRLDGGCPSSHITFMALSRMKATTIALSREDDRLLSRAARERRISRSEFIRQHLAIVLEQYRRHPKPRSAGIVRALAERGDERELFGADR
jgi:hypothetical protein